MYRESVQKPCRCGRAKAGAPRDHRDVSTSHKVARRSLHQHLALGAAAAGGEVREAAGQAEAAQLDAPVFVQQHVGRLQVAVDDALRVQELRIFTPCSTH